MKKVIWMLAAVLVTAPVFAQGEKDMRLTPAQRQEVRFGEDESAKVVPQEQKQNPIQAKMDATKKKAEKLVKEYNGLKAGKKKDAKLAEIQKFVGEIRDEQLSFREEKIKEYAENLKRMEGSLKNMEGTLVELKTDKNKKQWISEKTEALITANGDPRVLFKRNDGHFGGPEGRPGMMKDGKGPRHFGKDGKCPFAKDGKKGEEGKDCKCGKHDGKFHKGPRVGINPPPPPAKEVK